MKKATSILLALLMLLAALTGCGNTAQTAESAPETSVSAEGSSGAPVPEAENGMRLPSKMVVHDVARDVVYDGDTMTIMGEDGTKIVAECTPDGTHIKTTAYDAEGNVTECMEYLYEFDANGTVKKETSHNSNGVSLVREYDGERLLREERYYKDKLDRAEVYTYDEAGRVVSRDTLASDGTPALHATYEYDAQGHETSFVDFHTDGSVYSRTESVYDENGNRTEYVTYSGEYVDTRTEYTYDANGNKTSAFWQNGVGDFRGHTAWEYDAHNNVTKEIHYRHDGEVSETWEYVYQYDADGNKTETVCYHETVTNPRYEHYRRSFSYDGVNALGQGGMIEIVTKYAAYDSVIGDASHPAYVQEYILDGDGFYAGRWKDVNRYDDDSVKTYFAITETCTAPLTDAQYAAFEKVFLRVSANTETVFATLDTME